MDKKKFFMFFSVGMLFFVLGIAIGLFGGFFISTNIFVNKITEAVGSVDIETLEIKFNQTEFQDFLNSTIQKEKDNSYYPENTIYTKETQ